MHILMVCLGNICRSPIAEGVLKHKAHEQGLKWTIESAGTESYHIGEAPHQFSQKVCVANGVDISSQRARQFTRADLRRYDKIYALSEDVVGEIRKIAGVTADLTKVSLLLSEVENGSERSVPDPWYAGEEGYLPVYDLIDTACESIVRKYK